MDEDFKLRDRIAQAVCDPGSFLPQLHRDDDERRESVGRWSTRAVLRVLEEARWHSEAEVLIEVAAAFNGEPRGEFGRRLLHVMVEADAPAVEPVEVSEP